ncbi:recombinase family protein [Micromonospora sp. NPDC052213]|uniref:recombinase family protein n=1 Tax=Micromonospora sp. NPDC052213 TaxID=3155812 RepID=UPI003430071D
MFDHVRPGDALTVVSLDRLGRSLEDLIAIVGQLKRQGGGSCRCTGSWTPPLPGACCLSRLRRAGQVRPHHHRGQHQRRLGRRPRPRTTAGPAAGDDPREDDGTREAMPGAVSSLHGPGASAAGRVGAGPAHPEVGSRPGRGRSRAAPVAIAHDVPLRVDVPAGVSQELWRAAADAAYEATWRPLMRAAKHLRVDRGQATES